VNFTIAACDQTYLTVYMSLFSGASENTVKSVVSVFDNMWTR